MSKQLWFQSAAATTHRGVNDTKLAGAASWWQPLLLAEARGASATTATCASVAGTTVGIEFVNGAVALEWLSEPLSADFTISGSISLNLWGLESTMNDNTAINAVMDKIDGATGAVTQIAKSARVTELATANGVNFFTVTPTSTACKRGDRLRVRPFIDDAGAAMIVGTSTFSYNGPTGLAAGDSYVQFTEDLTFEPAGDPVVWLTQSDAPSGINFGDAASTERRAQAFVATGTSLAQVGLALFKQGSPADDLIVEIQSDSGGVPSGTVIGTVATIPAASVSTDISSTTPFILYPAAISLTASAKYWVVLRRSGAIDAANRYGIKMSAGAVGGAWEASKRFDGTAWVTTGTSGSFGTSLAILGATSTYYLTDTAETINPGSATEKKALTTRGSGSVNAVTNTANGPTTGIQVTATAGGTAVEWYTPPLQAVTFGGKAKFNIRALESSASANASLKAEVAVTATDGSGATVWGVANVAPSTTAGEVGTSDAAVVAWPAGDDTSITAGQRLRYRIYVEDIASGPLVTGFTTTVSYSGTTASAAGDTYVILPVTVTEQVSGPFTFTKSGYGRESL